MVAAHAILGQARDKILGCLCVLFGYHALIFDGRLAILLTFLLVSALAGHRAEYSRCRQYLIEVLELLTSSLLVTVADGTIVDLLDVREAVNDEGA